MILGTSLSWPSQLDTVTVTPVLDTKHLVLESLSPELGGVEAEPLACCLSDGDDFSWDAGLASWSTVTEEAPFCFSCLGVLPCRLVDWWDLVRKAVSEVLL